MRGGRELRSDEVIALTTLNCCANAILDNLPQLEKRLKGAGKGRLFGMAKGASKALAKLVQAVIEESGDPDQQTMIIRRMRGLHLQFGYVRKHPDDLVMMSRDDAETLLAPVLEKCDLECPCITYDEDGNRVGNVAMVKACETRKALKRIGLSENGIGMDCPYQMLMGRDKG